MRAIRRILFAIKDVDAVSPASLAKAGSLAGVFDAELDLFHAISTPLYSSSYVPSKDQIAFAEKELLAKSTEKLAAIAAKLHQEGIRATASVVWDYPAYEAIIRHATQTNADLIVAGQHSSRHFAPHLLRLTDWELLRSSPIPLLLVKDALPYVEPVVLAAVDPMHSYAKPSGLDGEILKLADLFSLKLQGKLHAVHALAITQLPIGLAPAEVYTTKEVFAVDENARREAITALSQELRPFAIADQNVHLSVGAPGDVIEQTAREFKAGIVVMGSVSRSGLKRLFIGNTAERVLDNLPCDVLLVKPKGFAVEIEEAPRGVQVTAQVAMV